LIIKNHGLTSLKKEDKAVNAKSMSRRGRISGWSGSTLFYWKREAASM